MADRPDPKRDFRAALKRADADQPGVTPEADKRLRERIENTIEAPGPRPAWVPWPALVAGLGLAAIVALGVWWPSSPRVIGGFEVADGAAKVQVDDSGRVSLASSVVVSDGVGGKIEALAESRIQHETSGFRIHTGTVRVAVTKRPAGAAPYEVKVSAGTIQVLGTTFTIEERGDAGSVLLHEGRIRFTHSDGTEVTLAPGERVEWPRPPPPPAPVPPAPEPIPTPAQPAPEPVTPTPAPNAPPVVEPPPTPAPSEPVPTPAPTPPTVTLTEEQLRVETLKADAVLAKVSGLRSRGRFDDAVKTLETALADAYGPSTRERLSYEQLSILAFQLHDAARACDALRQHVTTFGTGRYADGLEQVRAEHACAKP